MIAHLLLICLLLLAAGAPAWSAQDWAVEKSSNFHIYYRDVPEDFVRTVMEEAEADYRRVAENLGNYHAESGQRGSPISIYIYRDREDYISNGGEAGWSHGVAMFQSKTIRTYPSDSGFFDALLPHELGHILLHQYVGEGADVPSWFDEGVAMYQEKARRLGAHDAVRRAIKNDQFIPLTQLADMRLYKNTERSTVDIYYAEAASVVNYLISQMGQQRFFQLCRALKDQARFNAALSAVYPRIKDLNVLNTHWKQFVEGQ